MYARSARTATMTNAMGEHRTKQGKEGKALPTERARFREVRLGGKEEAVRPKRARAERCHR